MCLITGKFSILTSMNEKNCLNKNVEANTPNKKINKNKPVKEIMVSKKLFCIIPINENKFSKN